MNEEWLEKRLKSLVQSPLLWLSVALVAVLIVLDQTGTLELGTSGEGNLWVVILLGGALGGLCFGIAQRAAGQAPPSPEDAGWAWVQHIVFGFAGGFVVFILVPGELDPAQYLRAFATAIVGGFGARVLLPKALGMTMDEINSRLEKTDREVQKLNEEGRNDARALELVDDQLSARQDTPEVDHAELKAAIAGTSGSARAQIFDRAVRFRREHWESNPAAVGRLMVVFEALVEADGKETYHRSYGQLGYVQKDMLPPDYAGAIASFDRAIELRDEHKQDGIGWLYYEANRAIARIMLGAETTAGKLEFEKDAAQNALVRADLEAAAADPYVLENMLVLGEAARAIAAWAEANDVDLEELHTGLGAAADAGD